MPDIALCTGEGCRKRNTCYRFTATPSEYHQSYFTTPPVLSDHTCIYHYVKEIYAEKPSRP